MSSVSCASIFAMYSDFCMMTIPPLLSAGDMMMFGFLASCVRACVYLLGSVFSFGWEMVARMIPWVKPLEKSGSP